MKEFDETEQDDDSVAERIGAEETDRDRATVRADRHESFVMLPIEVIDLNAEIPRDRLEREYAVQVVEIRNGNTAPQYSVFWNGHFAFETSSRDIERQLLANGIHRTAELTGGRQAD